MEQLDQNFRIDKAGKLTKYLGPGGAVVIPEGVVEIGSDAFQGMKRRITSVAFPASLKEIDDRAFSGCTALTNVTCSEGLQRIGYNAFYLCTALKEIALPRTIRSIEGIGWHEGSPLYPTMPEGLPQTADKLGGEHDILTQFEYVWKDQLTPKDWAGLYLFQTSKAYEAFCRENMTAPYDPYLAGMIELLTNTKKKSAFERAANFALDHAAELQPEQIRALCELCGARKQTQAQSLLEPLLTVQEADPDDPFAFLRKNFSEPSLLQKFRACGGREEALETVRLPDGSPAPAFAVLCAVMPYVGQYDKPASIGSYEWAFINVSPVEQADQVAALLDRETLLAAILEQIPDVRIAHTWSGFGFAAAVRPEWLIPYCRYAAGKDLTKLFSEAKDWGKWGSFGQNGRIALIALRGALMLSETREAMMYLDKNKGLAEYAKRRGTTAETLRDTALADFGLDESGKKVYDLGGTRVRVTIGTDLKPSLFDETAGKPVKSLPKKNADPEKLTAASADLADLKKNVKKIVKMRSGQLLQDFLSAKTRTAKDWKAAYLQNPVLRQIASLLVWAQGETTFTLRDGTPVDADGTPCKLGRSSVKLAHPMEMTREDVAAWQKYFTVHGLRQPFAQVWEPVADPNSIRADRYAGIEIPVWRFKGQEKHGIDFSFHVGSSILELWFAGCRLDFDPGTAEGRHELNLKDGAVVLGKFSFDTYTRQTNHIVALLDKWTIIGRILKDDPSIVTMLDSATLAQIMEYLNLSIDNGKSTVTAELLNYKNAKFPDFDPLAEFTLDEL